MHKILTLNSIPPFVLKKFSDKCIFSDKILEPQGILVRSTEINNPQNYKNLVAIARAGAGTNNINIDKCNKIGVAVFNTPGANANAVKELVIGCLILSSRNILEGTNWTKCTKTDSLEKNIESEKKRFKGREISGKKLGVIGLGEIGTLVANAACALNMEVYGYDPFITINSAWNLCRMIKKTNSLEDLFATCDYITVHVPLNANTENMINSKLFSVVKNGAKFFNFSRAKIVNFNDIVHAIEKKKISNYVTDFPQKEFLPYKEIINIPHLGASTVESETRCATMAIEQLITFLETGNVKNSVNFPDINMPRYTKTRLCIYSTNVPNIINQILTMLSAQNINIENMQSHSKKQFAYTLIDTNGNIDEKLLKNIKSSDGIVSARIIHN